MLAYAYIPMLLQLLDRNALTWTPAMDVLNSAAWRLGYESLREEQAAVVHGFVEGNDVFASLETISSLTS